MPPPAFITPPPTQNVDPKTIVSALMEAVKDGDSEVRACAVWSLGKMGDRATESVPCLIAL